MVKIISFVVDTREWALPLALSFVGHNYLVHIFCFLIAIENKRGK